MALQEGIIKLKGTIGDMTFYKSKDGHVVRKRSSLNAERIAKDPAFQRTRQNGLEFGRAANSGKHLRTAMLSLLKNAKDSRVVSRLTTEMLRVIKADRTNAPGERNVIKGELRLLTGFDFNSNGKLRNTLYAPVAAKSNRATGELSVEIDGFVPNIMIDAPSGATHFQLVSAGAEVDFLGKRHVTDSSETAILPWNNVPTAPINLVNTVSKHSTNPLFLVLGVLFYQEVYGQLYLLKRGDFNPLAIILVDTDV